MAQQQPRERRKPRGLLRATDAEWAVICSRAKEAGRPTMTWAREHLAGGPPAPPASRRAAQTTSRVKQLGRILNNLRQLGRVADEDGDTSAADRLAAVAQEVEVAIMARPDPRASASAALDALLAAGVELNELAHRANTHEELPPAAELDPVLAAVLAAVRLEPAP